MERFLEYATRHPFLLGGTALLALAVLAYEASRARSGGQSVGPMDAVRLMNQGALLLDVRETSEYEGGRLPNALHVPLSQIESRAAELGKHVARPVIAYCELGNRSRMAGAALAKVGFSDVYHLNGGYRAWKDAGLPVEKTT